MPPPRLHRDADASLQALHAVLVARGHDFTRTPHAWMLQEAPDAAQLLGATAQGRVLSTFNVRDFLALAQQYPQHGGVLLAAQRRWTLTPLIKVGSWPLYVITESHRLVLEGVMHFDLNEAILETWNAKPILLM